MPSRAYVPILLLAFLALSAAPLLAQASAARGGGNGPPFCRSGAGHPAHGMSWCVQKGWAHQGQLQQLPARLRDWDIFLGDDARLLDQRPVRYDERREGRVNRSPRRPAR